MGAKEVLVAVGAALGVAVAASLTYRQLRKKKAERKGKKPLPKMTASLFEVTMNFTGPHMPQYLTFLSRTQPSVAVAPFPRWQTTVICSDPQAAKAIFAKCGKDYYYYGVLDAFLFGSTVFTDPSTKPAQRKDLLRAFDARSIEHFRTVSDSLAQEWLAKRAGTDQDFDLCHDMLMLALQTVSKAGFDYDMTHAEADVFLETAGVAAKEALCQVYNPMRRFLCTVGILDNNARVNKVALKAWKVASDIMEHYKKTRNDDKAPVGAAIFNSKCYEDDHHRLRDAIVVLLAAHDTTAFQTSWCINDLARFPKIQSELRRQLRACPQENWSKEVPLLSAVVKESQRLNSVGVAVFREAQEDVDLPSGHYIEAGSSIVVDIYDCLRNPEYFENPDDYTPERWLGTPEENQKLNSSFIAFTTGLRSCIGQSLAAAQLRSLIGCLVRDFEIVRTQHPTPSHALTWEPHGLRIKLRPVESPEKPEPVAAPVSPPLTLLPGTGEVSSEKGSIAKEHEHEMGESTGRQVGENWRERTPAESRRSRG
uniref:Cytochrome P450 n=1 Tax=Chromera velia CCMP2878 TaxID=1169474 RepID=A0A0G4FYW7_9ALVE|eukprot:Cvel_19377.t1-p1 / transcript=Cvel_19377.t1 / gene=Cvel_19377 / organism=Chromera_velia_CCMP2878 / gene_product=Cytochrome P450 315a1, mitochondrial, putative / transcript_product=Cytochrome P450 315a1, mitochondrial, putative / location=Cvel_scaffold1666:26664-28681(+) / protein_length=536 / sequence_SO=supercontig / SO=protein_coding / is_pseudo=false